ncbi:hypothetical protein HA48_19975 [Pantoea wallisii]|uniref:Uncharacterized protein n=1 Tax=Pantoea wallisii TaxID=1076551 RepID=A0A1X1CWY8_9GAMM|nr:hypothetical protein [Pantoea wallisii]ORM68841.1 hypothetical protein HA48_19975 [Pantoea wallisii]
MNEITPGIHNLMRENKFVTGDEMKLIIAFVNGLKDDTGTLQQFENDSNDLIIFHYENMVQGNNPRPSDVESGMGYEMRPLNGGARPAAPVTQNAYFSQFRSSIPGRIPGFSSTNNWRFVNNIYDKARATTYATVAGVLTAAGALIGQGVNMLAVEGAKAGGQQYEDIKSSRMALIGGTAGLASAALFFLLRNHLITGQTERNERFINATKRVVKAKMKLTKFIDDTRRKVITDTSKCKEKFNTLKRANYGIRDDQPGSGSQATREALAMIEAFIFTSLATSREVQANIVMDGQTFVSFTVDGNEHPMSEAVFNIFQDIGSVF